MEESEILDTKESNSITDDSSNSTEDLERQDNSNNPRDAHEIGKKLRIHPM